jgi:hypothetical protein
MIYCPARGDTAFTVRCLLTIQGVLLDDAQ